MSRPILDAGSGAAAWGDAGWICPYNMYLAYGDTNVICRSLCGSFQRYGQFDAVQRVELCDLEPAR